MSLKIRKGDKMEYRYKEIYLETIKLSCAIPLNHRLINKDILNIEDFYGENIML